MGTTTIDGGFVTPGRVQSVRAVVTWALRLTGLGPVLYAGFQIGARATFAVFTGGDVWQNLEAHMDIGSEHGLFRGVPMLIVGVVLMVASRWAARWVVAMPERGCPRCGYAGSVVDGVCPECGQRGVESAVDA